MTRSKGHRHCRRARGVAVGTAALGVALSSATYAAPPSSSYKLVFADNFDGNQLDTMKWNYNYPSWFLNNGHQHNHQGYMTPDRVVVGNGVVDLQAMTGRDPHAVDFNRDDFGWQQVNYTTGAINTSGKLNITRGYIETRIKLYGSVGSWPAIWMLGNGWPPEIDLMEFPRGTASGIANNNNTAMFNYHWTNGSGAHASSYKRDTGLPTLTDGYHTFALEWTASAMNFYVDGSLRHSVTDASAIADAQNMYLLLNQGVGGWAGNVSGDFESHFWVDYVKAWQIPGASDHTWKSSIGSGSWDTGSNWSTGLVPRFEDTIARFTANDNAAVNVTWNNSNTMGGLHFDTTTTAYTVGTSSGSLQFAKAASGAAGTIFVTAATSKPQAINSRVELYDSVDVTNNSTELLTLGGKVVGPGSIGKFGSGTLVLGGDNDFSGGIHFGVGGSLGDNGAVRLANSHAAGTGDVTMQGNNATSQVIELTGGVTIPNNLSTSGRNSPVFLRNFSGYNTWAGDVTLSGTGGAYAIESGRDSLQVSGNLTTNIAGATDRIVQLRGTAQGLITGVISSGATTKLGLDKQDSGTWILTGQNTYTAGTTVTAGTLVAGGASSLGSGPVTVNGGTLRVEHAQALGVATPLTLNAGTLDLKTGANTASVVPSLTLGSGANVELSNAALVIDHSAADTAGVIEAVRGAVEAGQIGSSLIASDPRLGIGFAEASAAGIASYGGVSFDADALLIRVALRGDANLDDAVNFTDLLSLARSYGTTSGKTWIDGDTNADGAVGFDDLLALAKNYGSSQPTLLPADLANDAFAADWALAQSVVPEPLTLGCLVLPMLMTTRRR